MTGVVAVIPKKQFFSATGVPLALGTLTVYLAGTVTPTNTWQDADLSTLNTNPIELDAAGRCDLWLDQTLTYKFILKNASGSEQWTVDDVPGANTIAGLTFLQAGTGAVARSAQSKMRDIVSAKDFGVAADGVTDDTDELNAFLLVADRGHIPAGTYKITGPLNFQSNQVITGDGPATIISYEAVAPAANSAVLNLSSISNTQVSDLKLMVPPDTYTSARSIYMSASTNCQASDIVFEGAGGDAGYIINSFRCSIKGCYIDDYRSVGLYVENGYGNTFEDNDIPDGSGGTMGIQLVGGESNAAINNRVAKTPDNYFGIHLHAGLFPVATGNTVRDTRREAIQLEAGQIGARVTNNTCAWYENIGTGDFGISVAGYDVSTLVFDFLIANNTIINAALDGIGIAGWCQRGRVTGNVIRDSARASSAGFQSGIKIYGWIAGAVADDITVEGNSIHKVDSTGLLYAVTEVPELGSVSGNIIRDNKSYGLTGNMYPVTTGARRALNSDDLNLISHTAAPTASAGTITTASGEMKYQYVGRFVMCRVTIDITTNGTGATTLLFALPFTPTGGVLSGAEISVNGKACKAFPSGGASLTISNYDNTYPGVDGAVLTLTGILELA
jgi:hypothetical protein